MRALLPPGRIAGLDAWRAGLMLGGVLLHATVLQPPLMLFGLIGAVSGAFRMGAFFAISGMLASLAAARKGPSAWLTGRTRQIGIPALVGLAVLCPAMSLMLRAAVAPELAAHVPLFDWHHLWFLVALLAHQLLGYAALTRVNPRAAVRIVRLLCATGQPGVLGALMTVSLVLMMGTFTAVLACAPPRLAPMLEQLRLIVGYAPLYLFGMLLGRSRRLRHAMLADWQLPAAVLLLAAVGMLSWFVIGPRLIATEYFARQDAVFHFVLAAACPPAAVVLILRSALRLGRVPAVVHQMCAASFTIYIVHYPILIAINGVAARLHSTGYFEYACAVLVAGTLSFAFHFGVVRRSATLSLLLNGQRPSRPLLPPVPALVPGA